MPTRLDTADGQAAPMTGEEFARLMEAVAAPVRLAVAVSGGADSLCLALLARDWAKARGGEIHALTVDHGLRPESAAEAALTAERLSGLGIRTRILAWQPELRSRSALQERARDARYRLMADTCREEGFEHLLLAHHLGDQAETFLMRLGKGSGLAGLAAMRSVVTREGVTLLRPLLDIPKARLEATLRGNGVDWIEDPSNRNPAFERVRTRNLLARLDREGLNAEIFAAAAKASGAIADALEAHVARARASWCRFEADAVKVQLEGFLKAPNSLQLKLLSDLLRDLSGAPYAPKTAKVEALLAWVLDGGGGRARTLGGCLVERKGSDLVFAREKPRRGPLASGRKMAYIQGNATAKTQSIGQAENRLNLAKEGVSALY